MKEDFTEEEWAAMRAPLKAEWPSLNDAALDHIGGRREQLIGYILDRHDESRTRVEWLLDELMGRVLGTEALQDSVSAHRSFRYQTADVAGAVERHHGQHRPD